MGDNKVRRPTGENTPFVIYNSRHFLRKNLDALRNLAKTRRKLKFQGPRTIETCLNEMVERGLRSLQGQPQKVHVPLDCIPSFEPWELEAFLAEVPAEIRDRYRLLIDSLKVIAETKE